MNETKFGIWKNLFEIWTNQEDLRESYNCRNEQTLAKLAMQSQHTSDYAAHLQNMK